MSTQIHYDYLQRALNGDPEAFGDFYESLLPEIYRFIYYQVNHALEAEDLTEMVFLKAWKSLQKSRKAPRNPRAWVYRIARNLVIDHYRTRRSQENLDEIPEPIDAETRSPEDQLLEKDERERIHVFLMKLPENLRQVIICRFIQGMNHAETAKALGLSPAHVRVLQHRALKKLRILANKDTSYE